MPGGTGALDRQGIPGPSVVSVTRDRPQALLPEQCVYALGALGGTATTRDLRWFFEANGDAVAPVDLSGALQSLSGAWSPPAVEHAGPRHGRGILGTWRLTERGRRMISGEGT